MKEHVLTIGARDLYCLAYDSHIKELTFQTINDVYRIVRRDDPLPQDEYEATIKARTEK